AHGESSLCGTSNQLTENGGDFFKFRGFVEEMICAGGEAFIAILGIRIVRANQNAETGMIWTNCTEYVEAGASGHLQVKNHSVWLRFVDTTNRLRHVACLSCKLDTGHIPQKVGQRLDNGRRVICNKNPHFPPPQRAAAHV